MWLGWNDEEDINDVFFASVHAYHGNFYPGTGSTEITSGPPKICNIGFDKENAHLFREFWLDQVLPNLIKFQPHLVFISAGFDSHFWDPVGGINGGGGVLTSEDYYWITDKIGDVLFVKENQRRCGGIVSVLEGGYNVNGFGLSPLSRSVQSHIEALENKNIIVT